MKFLRLACALASAWTLVSASRLSAHSSTDLKIKESIVSPLHWTSLGPAPPTHVLSLRIALPQPSFHILEQHLYEVSDPEHHRYGQHLSKEQVEELVRPEEESVRTVLEWLQEWDIHESELGWSAAGDWVYVKVNVEKAEEMLGTKYYVYQHDTDGDILVRTTSYSLPSHLHPHIDLIQPTTMFARLMRQNSLVSFVDTVQDQTLSNNGTNGTITDPVTGVTVDASCNTTITVTCIRELYSVDGYKSDPSNGNEMGITGYLDQFANFEDLQLFYADQVPQAVNTSFTVISINGGENNQTVSEAGAEADLDVQFAFGITFPTPGIFWTTGGSPPFIPDLLTPTDTNEPYLTWLDYVLSNSSLPQTISTSYADSEQSVPESYANRACAGFAQLGARGVSLLFGSGDNGVGDGQAVFNATTNECVSNDGTNRTVFIPLFPASCPYITSVGATQRIPEVAVSRFFSGGGFSNYFSRPSYQDEVVASYFTKFNATPYLDAGLFNPSGRAIPDVSAQGDFLRIFFQGSAISIGGTSAATPTFAAIVSLLNDARISAGKAPLGFLNPLLYSRGFSALNDITVGNNAGCGTEGFECTEGWDPVTGLGTPDFAKLKDIVLSE